MVKNIVHALSIEAKPEKEGFFEGRGYALAWMPEEPVSLATPEDYGKSRLEKTNLPFIPEPLVFSVRKKKTRKGMVTDKSTVRQLEVIRKILDRADSIIVATEPGERGEQAFRNVYSYLECEKPFRRLWLNSTTAGAIREGFKNLHEASQYDNLYAGADCRTKVDYLININAGAAFGLATGIAGCPFGRLQIPVLAIICKRFLEQRKSRTTRFFEHRLMLEKDGLSMQFRIMQDIRNRKTADKIYAYMKSCESARILKIESQAKIQPAPLPYNLTALQKDACARYGFSAQKTLEIAQKLYEGKLVSYPCTDSRHIPGEFLAAFPKLLRQTAYYCGLMDCLSVFDWDSLNRRSVGNTDISGHHALIPTGIYPGYLTKESKAVYDMIAARTLEVFAPDCEMQSSHIEAAVGNLVFNSKKSRVLSPSWRTVLNREEDRAEDEAPEEVIFPEFLENETVRISGWNLLTHKILPLTPYTEGSLLEKMENHGLGTPFSRSTVIEALIEWEYIQRQGQYLMPAERGLVIFNCIKDMRIADLKMAGGWEKALRDVGTGEQNAGTFLNAMKIFTRQVTGEILSLSTPKKS